MPQVIVGHGVAELFYEHGPLGPWPHEAHITLQDVEELGQFIDVGVPQPLADARAAAVMVGGPNRARLTLGVGSHASELDDAEPPAPLPHAFLRVKNGAAEVTKMASDTTANSGESSSRPRPERRISNRRFTAHARLIGESHREAAWDHRGDLSFACSSPAARRSGSEARSIRSASTGTQCTLTSDLVKCDGRATG